MGSMSIVHWMIVIGIVVLLFGRHKISDLMGDVAHGIKSFKKGMQDDEGVSTAIGDQRSEDPVAAPSRGSPLKSERATIPGIQCGDNRRTDHNDEA